jgi:drug/metabolite transporter (DMT)-like permease
MKRLLNNPFALLIGTGAALAAIAPLGKLAQDAGINPFLWVLCISLIPGLALFWAAFGGGAAWRNPKLWRFGFVSGIFANVIPLTLVLFAIPHIGSGLGGLMFALSPVVTAIISTVLRVRPPTLPLVAGVAMGFAGAVIIVASRNSLALPEAPQWLLAALVVPVSLAIGNVYRTAFWPEGATPMQVGVVVNLAIVPVMAALAIWWGGGWQPMLTNLGLSAAQWLASIIMLTLFFRLQLAGGPTYLSQIGYVAATVSLTVGALVFKESYPTQVWLGAALIIAGIGASYWELFRSKPH